MDQDIYDHLYHDQESEIAHYYRHKLQEQAKFYQNEINNLQDIKYEGSEFTHPGPGGCPARDKQELSYDIKREQRNELLRHADALKDAIDEIHLLKEGNKELRAELERLRDNVDKILDEENKALHDQVVTLLDTVNHLRSAKGVHAFEIARLEDEKKRLEKAKDAYLNQCHRAEERLSFLGRTISDTNSLIDNLTQTNKNLRDKITKEEDRLKSLPTEEVRDKARKLDL